MATTWEETRPSWVKIVATLGPASESAERVEALIRAGVNVFRLNFSHGDHASHALRFQRVREIAARLDRHVAILQDLQGPKIRVGDLEGGQAIPLVRGERLTITTRPIVGRPGLVSTTYTALPGDVRPGDRILLDDGLLELRVIQTSATEVETEVVHGGLLGQHKGINLPNVAVSAPALTEKDLADLQFGLTLGVDLVALSFVRRAADVHVARSAIRAAGHQTPIIVKLEKPEALVDLEAILGSCDGVMVARGDLGVEMPPEQVPLAQKRIIARAIARGLPVITATQMLESMVHHARPTRAEASDVANAVLDGTDAVMLSAETAVGAYPVEAVTIMRRIALEVEGEAAARHGPVLAATPTNAQALAHAAANLADTTRARALVVLTSSGRTAHLVAAARPAVPIYAFTDQASIARRLALVWGVVPLVAPRHASTDAMIEEVVRQLLQRGLAEPGDSLILIGSAPTLQRGQTNFIKLHTVPPRDRGNRNSR